MSSPDVTNMLCPPVIANSSGLPLLKTILIDSSYYDYQVLLLSRASALGAGSQWTFLSQRGQSGRSPMTMDAAFAKQQMCSH